MQTNMKIREKLTYWILTILSGYFTGVNFKHRIRIARRLAAIAYRFIPIRKSLVAQNMRIAFPLKSEAWIKVNQKKCYSHFMLNFIQFLSLPKSFSSSSIKVLGLKYLDQIIAENKGVILITGHFGLWEMVGNWLGTNNYSCYGIIAKQQNKGGDFFFKEIREKCGMKQIYKNSVKTSMNNILKNKNILILASDQDARSHGIFVDFFGKPSSTAKGAAIFHLRTKAPMIFCTSYINRNSEPVLEFEKVNVMGPKNIKSITQAYTYLLERKVRTYPDHYFWFHRKWKTSPENIN